MKPVAVAVILLGLVSFGLAQQPGSATQSATPSASPATTPPQGRRPPQAKTQPEFDAYQAAMRSANDPAAIEKAADDFSAKYPTSELRILLYRTAMHSYQTANNGAKMMEMGRKVLAIDPDDPEALLGVSEVTVEQTGDNDLNKDQRLAEALKMAQHCLETIDTDISIPAGTPQEKVDSYKGFLRSSADAVIGAIQYDQEKYADSEASLRKSIDAYPSQPDPVAIFRLALALDKQEKYPEALKYANQAVGLTQESSTVGTAARHERDRLIELTGGIPPAPDAKPTSGAAAPPPSK
ncbi:MAG: tetratricopeptide repeat protein [Terriglobales bacterium]